MTRLITPEEIKADNNYAIGIEYRNISVYLLYRGGPNVEYFMFHTGELLFHGDDLRPGAMTAPDSLDCIISLLGFLTCKPGDTDLEYFAKYTQPQLEWCESFECEQLQTLVGDYENRDDEEGYHTNAVDVFKSALV